MSWSRGAGYVDEHVVAVGYVARCRGPTPSGLQRSVLRTTLALNASFREWRQFPDSAAGRPGGPEWRTVELSCLQC